MRRSSSGPGAVTAPSEAELTSAAYLASTPVVTRGAMRAHSRARQVGVDVDAARADVDAHAVAVAQRAIGPPRAASGAMWPTMKPCVAPLKRPSVISATSLPRPWPTSAAVTASISRMPGPPAGPSKRITTTSPAWIARACTAANAASSESNTRAGPSKRSRPWPASLTMQPSGREVAVEDRIAAARLERDRRSGAPRPGARAPARRRVPAKKRAAGDRGDVLDQTGRPQLACHQSACRPARTCPRRCSGRRASGRRSPACARRLRIPPGRTATPASCAIASRCSAALVEPAVAETARAALRSAAGERMARGPGHAVAQLPHHQRAAGARGGGLVGMDGGNVVELQRRQAEEGQHHRHRVGGELAAAGAGAGTGVRFDAVQFGIVDAAGGMRADGFEHVLHGQCALCLAALRALEGSGPA